MPQGFEIQRPDFVAEGIVAAGQNHHGVVLHGLAQPGPIEIGGLEPDRDETDAAAESLDDAVGGERGRHGHHADVGRRDPALADHGVEYGPDPLGQVGARRQGLGLGQHAALFVEQNRIRVGAAGVDSNQMMHGARSRWIERSA